jgi:peptidyl-prolyl cis-trans isomerase B (cyclophilin B)
MSTATIETNKGTIELELYDDATPGTVENFRKLIKDGFYDGLAFHRYVPDFVIQGGCPNSREGAKGMAGTGGPGYTIKCETQGDKQVHEPYVLSMAHAGPNTGGSQFFICFVPCPHLDGVHTVFGGIEQDDADSMSVLDSIEMQDTIEKVEILAER